MRRSSAPHPAGGHLRRRDVKQRARLGIRAAQRCSSDLDG